MLVLLDLLGRVRAVFSVWYAQNLRLQHGPGHAVTMAEDWRSRSKSFGLESYVSYKVATLLVFPKGFGGHLETGWSWGSQTPSTFPKHTPPLQHAQHTSPQTPLPACQSLGTHLHTPLSQHIKHWDHNNMHPSARMQLFHAKAFIRLLHRLRRCLGKVLCSSSGRPRSSLAARLRWRRQLLSSSRRVDFNANCVTLACSSCGRSSRRWRRGAPSVWFFSPIGGAAMSVATLRRRRQGILLWVCDARADTTKYSTGIEGRGRWQCMCVRVLLLLALMCPTVVRASGLCFVT